MRLQSLNLKPYALKLSSGTLRRGLHLHITTTEGETALGDIAPLPEWSREILQDATDQILSHQKILLQIEWRLDNWEENLLSLNLYPSVAFGLESALLELLAPVKTPPFPMSVLLMGSVSAIYAQATLRKKEGFSCAKVKVNNLSFEEAREVIETLKKDFSLRVDVNRAWETKEALKFFSAFHPDTFDYVEEPFQNPRDLHQFPLPLAIDESFPYPLTIDELEKIPQLKALIYKPMIQGGLLYCRKLAKWAEKREVQFILSSSFESEEGCMAIQKLAARLHLPPYPLGLGTLYHHKVAAKNRGFC